MAKKLIEHKVNLNLTNAKTGVVVDLHLRVSNHTKKDIKELMLEVSEIIIEKLNENEFN